MGALQYKRLVRPLDFRLLKLKPSRGEEPLVSSLINSSLNDRSHVWIALSYTWGDPHSRDKLICNGVQISITANLHSALRRLRLTDRPVLLWADAICINQRDKKEKEAQVRLMRRIYSRADLVVADLGEAGSDYNDVAEIYNALTHLTETTAEYEHISYERYEMFRLPSYNDKKWQSWRRFLALPWWSRVWVFQEYALASKVNMMYGTLQLQGEALPLLISKLNHRNIPSNILEGADSYEQQHTANINCAAMLAMLSVRRDVKADRSRGLLHHLHHLSSFCEATDKRDKVYALLGLATAAERSALHINYSESTAEVYHRTARLLIEQGSGAEIMYEAACCPYLEGLPSWAPNWSESRIVVESLGWINDADGERIFRATGFTKCRTKISSDGRLLNIRGICIDSIEAMTEPGIEDADGLTLRRAEYLWTFERASRALVGRYEKFLRYTPAQALNNVLWRTLICDMAKDASGNLTRPAPSSLAECYHVYLQLQRFHYDAELRKTALDKYEATQKMIREAQPFSGAFEHVARGRRFCVTRNGYVGLVPTCAMKGDEICVFLGSAVPFVVSKDENGSACLVGESYIHGLMDGEALDMVLDVDSLEERDIVLG